MRRRVLVLSAVSFLAGCAGHSTRSEPQAPACCGSLGDATFVDYLPGDIVAAVIDEASSKYQFSTGVSQFSGVRVLPAKAPYSVLETVTHSEGIWLPSATIFVPRFAFLDKSFKELTTVEPDLYQSTGKLADSGIGRRAFYGACFVPPATAYVVIHTDAASLGTKTVRLLNPGGAGASMVLERAKGVYQRIDKRAFAAGEVRHIPGSNAFATFLLPRKATGEIHFVIS